MGFADQCNLAVQNTYNTYGSVTLSNVAVLTPAAILAMFRPGATAWAEMTAMLKNQLEMRACGVRRNGFYDWLMSSNKPGMGANVTVRNVAKGPSLIEPFILARQQAVWNSEHWQIVNSYDKATYDALTAGAMDPTLNPLEPLSADANARAIRVTFPAYGGTAPGYTAAADYFLPGKRIVSFSRDGTGKWCITQFVVLRAAAVGTGANIDIEAVHEPSTITGILANPGATSGIVLNEINNVNNYEAWCYNMLNVNTEKRVPFWYQTWRKVRRVNSQYEQFLAKMMEDNLYYSIFQDLPLAQRNAQDELRSQKEFCNSFLFGKPISDNQTLALWGSLPQISSVTGATVDPGTGSQLIAYRAHMIGVVPQLAQCSQLQDVSEQDISIKTILETNIYDVYRARESMGRPSNMLDIYTSSSVGIDFQKAFVTYSTTITGDIVRINIEGGEPGEWGFPYTRYRLYKPNSLHINIITDLTFDDFQALTPATQYIGKMMLALDLGTGGSVYPAVLASSRKQYTTGQIEDLAKVDSTFSCVMDNPTVKNTLTSETCTAIVECPKNNLAITNWKNFVP